MKSTLVRQASHAATAWLAVFCMIALLSGGCDIPQRPPLVPVEDNLPARAVDRMETGDGNRDNPFTR